jgi:hypothetical protein
MLRRRRAIIVTPELPPEWDAILLYDELLGLKVGRVKIQVDQVMRHLEVVFPPELARLIIEFSRTITYYTGLDIWHASNIDVIDILSRYGLEF